MLVHRLWMVLLLGAGLGVASGCAEPAQTAEADPAPTSVGGDERNGAYMPAIDWMKLDKNMTKGDVEWGDISSVSAIDPNRVFVVTWGDKNAKGEIQNPTNPTHMIVVLDRDGNVIENWSQWDSLMHTPHEIYVDPYDPAMPVWVVERGTSGGKTMEVLKFSNDGKQLLLRLGKGEIPPATVEEARARKPGPYQYGQPAVMAFYPNGDFLLGDGYWNCRVVRYNAKGELLSEFGKCGKGDGEFDTVHGLAVDKDGRIYVADRSNDRIQVFEEDGTWVATWPNIASPACVWVDESNAVWVCGRTTNRMLKYDTEGHLLYYWGTYGRTSGGFDEGSGGFERPHGMSVDRDGNFYVANFDGDVAGKFTPSPGADRTKLVLPLMKLGTS
jgi:sugar lactone lactonase YvrE